MLTAKQCENEVAITCSYKVEMLVFGDFIWLYSKDRLIRAQKNEAILFELSNHPNSN